MDSFSKNRLYILYNYITKRCFITMNRLACQPKLQRSAGGVRRNRTADLLNAIQTLYRLSYNPSACHYNKLQFFCKMYYAYFIQMPRVIASYQNISHKHLNKTKILTLPFFPRFFLPRRLDVDQTLAIKRQFLFIFLLLLQIPLSIFG